MPPKSKPAPANSNKPANAASTSNGSEAATNVDVSQTNALTKPDKAAYDAEQEKLKGEIDAVQVKLSAVKDKIALATKSDSDNDRRTQLRSEFDDLRSQSTGGKNSRSKVFEELRTLRENVQNKTKALSASQSKTRFRTVAELDAHIRNLDKQVESGSLKLADEKRALQEISQTKRLRKTVENFQADEDAIAADRARMEELKAQLDDPEYKKAEDRMDAIKSELDALKKLSDEAFANRNKLFDERAALQAQMDGLYEKKRESAQRYRELNDLYWERVKEVRARQAERIRNARKAEEDEKRQAVALRMLEEASQPAYQVQIEDCQTLIDYFSGKLGTAPPILSTSAQKHGAADEPKHDIRVVDAAPQAGLTALKKKGGEEEAYFVGGKSKKSKKGVAAKADGALNIPFPTLSALLALSIPPPTSNADITRVVEDLGVKKAWFVANQARATTEAVDKAKAEIERLAISKGPVQPSESAAIPPAAGQAEPLNERVVDKVEDVKEGAEAAIA